MPFEQPHPSEFMEQETNGRLSKIETKIVSQLTETDKERLKGWHKTDFLKQSAEIVAIRSEDLLYFLECVHRGYIPVGKTSPIRIKNDTRNFFFANPNPENPDIVNGHAELLKDNEHKTFREAVSHNVDIYADIGISQAIYRNIVAPYLDTDTTQKLARELYHSITGEDEPLDRTEFYFDNLTEEAEGAQKDCFQKKNTKPALFALGKYLKEKGVEIAPLADFLVNMGHRGSICVAFNKKLIETYKATADKNSKDATEEFVVEVPDGKLSLDTIYGFESLGDFEDQILEKLGVADNH